MSSIRFVIIILLLSTVGLSQIISPDNQEHTIYIESGRSYYEWTDIEKNNVGSSSRIEQVHILTLSADFVINYIWLYNTDGIDIFVNPNQSSHQVYLEEGIYHVMLGYSPSENSHTLFVRDSIIVNSSVIEHFSSDDSLYTTEFRMLREDGSPLSINTMSIRFFNNILDRGLHLFVPNISTISYNFKYNNIPSYFNSEWVVKGKQLANEDNLYLLNGPLSGSLKDTLIQNNPGDLVYADFTYHLPDSINQMGGVYIHTYNPSSHRMGIFDPNYNYPFKQRIYQDTTASIELLGSIFWQGVLSYYVEGAMFYTPEIRIQSGSVQGYHYEGRSYTPFIISETNEVNLGLTPTYWFGKFINDADTIKIRSPYGRFHFLFLSQTNDLFNHNPINYSIYSADSLYSHGEFKWWFEAGYRLGFDIDDLTIPVSTGKYEMCIIDDQIEVVKQRGISQVRASFDLGLEDKNPPNLSNFQIKTGRQIANRLDPIKENSLQFRLEDDVELDNIEVYYSSFEDTNWVSIPVEFISPLYKSYFPVLTEGYYNLKLKATDVSGNYIDCFIAPAFHIGEVTSINNQKLVHSSANYKLHRAYPNPFNPKTTISFDLPKREHVLLEIYNTIGQKIETLINEEIAPGHHSIDFEAKELSSGLYLYMLKTPEYSNIKKMIYLK